MQDSCDNTSNKKVLMNVFLINEVVRDPKAVNRLQEFSYALSFCLTTFKTWTSW